MACSRDTGELFCDKLRQVFLELPRFTKSEAECETDFDRWIYTLKNMETFKNIPFQPYMAVFKELEQITDIASMTKEERLRYDESIKIYRDNLAVMEFAVKAAGIATEIIARSTGLDPAEISVL